MRKLDKLNIFMYIAIVLLLFNAAYATFTGITNMVHPGCNERCVGFSLFIIAWGIVGVTSGVLLLKRYIAAIWGGSLFFLLQTLAISTGDFIYNMNYGLHVFISIGDARSLVHFNILSILAIVVLVSSFVSEYQNRPQTNPE